MIRNLTYKDNDKVMELLKKNSIVNYFIISSLEREKYKKMFEKKWGQFNKQGELISVLFKRKSGTLKFYSSQDYDVEEICSIIKSQNFYRLIGEKSIINKLVNNYNFVKIEESSFISKLERLNMKNKKEPLNIKPVTTEDIDKIIDLYNLVFTGFIPKQLMIEKYRKNTGRGYYIEDKGNIISTAQSSYETSDNAIIVGVATHPDYRKKGFATQCLIKLCTELVGEGKILYLQYDNPKAGNIYKELGFKDVGKMVICYNYSNPITE